MIDARFLAGTFLRSRYTGALLEQRDADAA
jgi:hypothetical protein